MFDVTTFVVVFITGLALSFLYYGILVKAHEAVERSREEIISSVISSKAFKAEQEIKQIRSELNKLKLEINAMKLDVMRLNEAMREDLHRRR